LGVPNADGTPGGAADQQGGKHKEKKRMDWLIGGVVVVLVIAGGVSFTVRTRTPERLVTPSPAAGWDEALANMPRGAGAEASALALEEEDLLAGTETAAVSPDALPPLDLDFDLDLDTPANKPGAAGAGQAVSAQPPSPRPDSQE